MQSGKGQHARCRHQAAFNAVLLQLKKPSLQINDTFILQISTCSTSERARMTERYGRPQRLLPTDPEQRRLEISRRQREATEERAQAAGRDPGINLTQQQQAGVRSDQEDRSRREEEQRRLHDAIHRTAEERLAANDRAQRFDEQADRDRRQQVADSYAPAQQPMMPADRAAESERLRRTRDDASGMRR
ncbi:hypothetical protein LTR95_009106 [Oleoguttula sp. CCFEE 5521]